MIEVLNDNCVERPPLTQKEREVLNFIGEYWKNYQLYPSFREIGAGMNQVNRIVETIIQILRVGLMKS